MILDDSLGWFVFEVIGSELNPMGSGPNRLFLQRLLMYRKHKGENKGKMQGKKKKTS